MKKLILSVAAATCLSAYTPTLQAQTTQAEKTYEISGKAKRGTLANVEFLNSSYVLYYVTKTTSRKMKFEIYTFDKDFNFVGKNDEELEFEQARTKYKWFKFKKEEYSVEGLSVEPNMMGTLILKKKRVTYSFDPIFWGYRKKVEVLDKVKPKTEDGNKLFYFTHIEDDNSGDAYILVGEKAKGMKEMKEDPDRQYKKYHLMRFNKDCDLVSDVPLEFQYPVVTTRVSTLPVDEVNEPGVPSIGDICIMFAPAKIKGVTKTENPNKNEFTFVRLNNQNKQLARVNFNSPSPGWRVDDLIYDATTSDIFYYGPSAEGKDEYQNQAITASKFKAVQLMKIHNNQVEYLTSTNLDEFESKLKTPPSQKKSPAYKGKKFAIASYYVPANGDFVVVGQNFDPAKDGINYKDVLAFHFDQKGVLRSQYGLDILETNTYAQSIMTPQQFISGADKNNLYWFVKEIDGVNAAGRVLTYGRIGKIGLSDANIGDFKMLGSSTGKKPEYFLDPNFPYLTSETPGTIVFFGSDKKEKNIWFSRIFLD